MLNSLILTAFGVIPSINAISEGWKPLLERTSTLVSFETLSGSDREIILIIASNLSVIDFSCFESRVVSFVGIINFHDFFLALSFPRVDSLSLLEVFCSFSIC